MWHHVAVIFYGGSKADLATHLKLYVDGRLETITGRRPQQIATSTGEDASIPVTIGRYIDMRANFPKVYTRGQVDELYIVEGALTPRQIVELRDHNT